VGRALVRLLAAAVLLAGPLLLWRLSFAAAVRHDIETLATAGDAPEAAALRAAASARLAALGPEALPEVLTAFAFNEAPPQKGVTLQRSGLSQQPGPLVVPAMYWLRERAGPDVVAALVAGLGSADHDVRHFAGLTLAYIGKDAVPALVTTLRSSTDQGQRAAAAFSLSFMGADGAEALAPLHEALSDPDKDVRLTARYAVQQLGPGNEGFWAAIDAARKSRPR
jgi:HEAT repeat protein